MKRVDRKFNASDMLTHSPSAEELRKFLPMIGCHTMTVNRENYNAVKTMLKAMPAAKVTAFYDEHGRRSKVLISVELAGVWPVQWRSFGAVVPERVVVWSCCANG